MSPGQAIAVEVPATSANVGPGFDCFGLALDWREQVDLEVTETGYAVEVSGEGADLIPRDESHLVLSLGPHWAWPTSACRRPAFGCDAHNTLPHGRGLGSSSAAIVAGLLAARGLAGPEPDPGWILRHATPIEGHPDNVAAAIYGGFVLAYDGGAGVAVARARVLPEITGWLFVAAASVETTAARRLLPDSVPHVDAAANSSRAALLVHALSDGARPLGRGDPGLAAPGVPRIGHAALVRAPPRTSRAWAGGGDQRSWSLGPGARASATSWPRWRTSTCGASLVARCASAARDGSNRNQLQSCRLPTDVTRASD